MKLTVSVMLEYEGHVERVKLLISSRADINCTILNDCYYSMESLLFHIKFEIKRPY